MKTSNQKKHNNKNIVGSVAAGVAGAVAIAGVAVAATMVLTDEKTRKKVNKAITDVKDQAMEYVDALKTGEKSVKENGSVKKPAKVVTKKLEKKITEVKNYGNNNN